MHSHAAGKGRTGEHLEWRVVTRPDAPPRTRALVRPEIQALRALAVLGVVLYHLWPNRLTGGFVGVDVFFVVSGFLITDHLLREVDLRRSVDLPAFWARRARRLLPASFLTIAATAVAVYVWVPENRWPQFGRELVASTFYVENWELGRQSVDYLAQSNVTSPSQHFWSLGVEEQFYLVWPIMIGAVALLALRTRVRPATLVGAALLLVAVASLVHSVQLTASDPGPAYFSTFTRAWEFAAGGLLAWVGRTRFASVPTGPRGAHLATAVSWSGAGAIAAAMYLYTGSTPFPGYTAALPVVGTLAVVWAAAPATVWSPAPIMRWRPTQWVGDVSYGVYLWHWPLIVLVPFVTAMPLRTIDKIAILGLTMLLAQASKTYVEDPIRTGRRLRVLTLRPRRTFAVVGVTSLVILAGCVSLVRWEPTPLPTAAEIAADSCLGGAALVDPDCTERLDDSLVADAAAFAGDLPPAQVRACETSANSRTYTRCELGSDDPAALGVAFIGDSHGTRMAEPLRTTAQQEGWRLSTFLVSGCPMAARVWVGSTWGADATYSEICRTTAVDVFDEVLADPTVDVVVMTNRTRVYLSDDPENWPLAADDVAAVITEFQAAGKAVVVLRDPPEMRGVPVEGAEGAVDCVLRVDDPRECSLPRDEAGFDDPMRAAAVATGAPVVDLDDLLCDDTRCLSQVGGVVVYTDDNHLSLTYARTIQRFLGERLVAAVDEARKDRP